MKSTSTTTTAHPWLRVILAACVGVFACSLLVPLLQPIPRLPWYDGVLLETVLRLQQGGSTYQGLSNGSRVPAESPYFPSTVFITWAASTVLPLGAYWPRVLGTAATFLLFAAGWKTATRLTKSSVASGILTILGFSVLFAGVEKFQAQSFFPDYLLGASALLAANIAARDVREPFSLARCVSLAALLFLIGTLKQSGFAIFVGFGMFAVWPGADIPRASRLRLLVVLTIAGLGVLAVIGATSHCWEATIAAMSGHPIIRTAIRTVFLLAVALLSLSVIALGFLLPPRLDAVEKSVTQLIVASFVPLLVIQSLSAFKAGGGSYDFLLPLFLGLPLLVTGLLRYFNRNVVPLLMALGLAATVLSTISGVREYARLAPDWGRFRQESAYLARFRGQRALYNVYSYGVIRHAGILPVTDLHTLTHYALGGLKSATVLESIRRRDYDIVVGVERATLDQTAGNPFFRSAIMGEYGQAILQNYQAIEDPELPASLKGQMFLRIGAKPRLP